MHLLRSSLAKRVWGAFLVLLALSLAVCVWSPVVGATLLGAGALGCLVYFAATMMALRGAVRRRIAERPVLTDEEFHARFFERRGADPELVRAVRRLLAERFHDAGGYRLWPFDKLDDVLHLVALSPGRTRALVRDICDAFDIGTPELAGVTWLTLDDIYRTVQESIRGRRPLPPPRRPLLGDGSEP